MKKHVTVIIGVLFGMVFLLSSSAFAQAKAFAFVDFQKFATESKKAQVEQSRFGDLVRQKREDLEKRKKEIDRLQEELQKQGPMLKEDTRNQKIKEIGIKEMEFKLAERDAQSQLQNEQRDAEQVLQQDIKKIINAIRQEKNLTIVFNSMALLSADDALDITEEVIKRYDALAGGKPAAAKPAPAAGPAKPAPAAAPAKPAPPAAKPTR
ncbi:MAG: OmpH family outer membrane protein [Deltaproteobacteria bacterium]|nr:OmpH family outer membrane protein [Deltaproteobacteria bacterium]